MSSINTFHAQKTVNVTEVKNWILAGAECLLMDFLSQPNLLTFVFMLFMTLKLKACHFFEYAVVEMDSYFFQWGGA